MTTQLNNVYLRSGGKLSLALGTDPTRVYGSTDADIVTIAAGVSVVLDGSFNRGNDIIRFTGNAASYSVVRVNASTVRVTDAAGTSVTIPVGSAGTAIEFADATRTLSGSSAGILLGNQTITATPVALAAGTAPAPVEEYILTSSAPTVTEGNDGTKTLTYLLTLNKAPTSEVTVNYQTTDAGTAAAGDDFQVVAGIATFAPGQTATTVSVTVYADTIVEADETVALRLSGSKLVAAVDALGTIRNDDSAPVDPTAYTVTAGDIAAANASNVPVTLNIGNTGSKTVTIQSDGASATQGIIINGDANATVNSGAAGDKVTLSGNGNNSINTGAGNDTVQIYGSGSNTINLGTGSDTVVAGSGNDTIIVGPGDLNAADQIDGGTGYDIVQISGDGNVADIGAGGNLVNIEELVLVGTTLSITEANLEGAIAAGLVKITGNPASSVITVTSAGGAGAVIDLTGLTLSGVKELKVDGAANVTVKLSESQIAAIGKVSDVAGNGVPTINTTVAGYQALGTKAPGVTVTITDSVQNLLAAGNSISGVTAQLGDATVAEAASALASGLTVSYKLVDTAANLALAPLSAYQSATEVNVQGNATAAQAAAIQNSLAAVGGFNAAKVTLNVADTASLVASSAYADQIDADTLTADSPLTVAQAISVYAKNPGATFSIVDTATAINAALTNTTGGIADLTVLNAAASVKLTSAATNVATIDAINTGLAGAKVVAAGYNLSDTLTALSGASAVVAAASNVTVTNGANVGYLTVSEALSVLNFTNTGAKSYALKDTYATIVAANSSVISNAATVQSTTTTLNQAQMNNLVNVVAPAKLVSGITVTDTVANLLNLSAAAVGEAAAITVSAGSKANVDQLMALKTLTGASMPSVAVLDTAANLTAAVAVPSKLAQLNDAQTSSVSLSDAATVAQAKAINTALTGELANTFTLADTVEALVAAISDAPEGQNVIQDAAQINVLSNATVGQVNAIATASGLTLGTTIAFALSDTASALIADSTAVNAATSVNITDATTVANVGTIATAFGSTPPAAVLGTNVTFSLKDSFTNLFTGVDQTPVAALAAAGTVTVSGTLGNLKTAILTTATTATKAEIDGLEVTGTPLAVTALNAADVNSLAAVKPTTYTLADNYTNLTTYTGTTAEKAAMATMVGAASVVIVDGPTGGTTPGVLDATDAALTVTQFNTLDAATSGTIQANITGSVSGLAAGNAVAAIAAAKAASATITVTGTTATVDEIATLKARGLSTAAGGELASVGIVDTAAAINAAAASLITGMNGTVKLSDNGTLNTTVAVAQKVYGNSGSSYGSYSLTDSATALAGASSSLIGLATTVTANTAATVTEAATLATRTTLGTVAGQAGKVIYNVTGTATALAGATAAMNGAVNITATGTAATVVEAEAIKNATNSGTKSYAITDSASALATATTSQKAAIEAASGDVTANTSATGAEATKLAAFTKAVGYSVLDSATNLAANTVTAAALNEAVNISVTGTASAAVLAKVFSATNTTGTTTVSSASMTAAEAIALAVDANDKITDGNGATVDIQITGTTTLAQAAQIAAKFTGTNFGGIVFDKITGASADLAAAQASLLQKGALVVATDAATLAQATAFNGNVDNYSVTDSYANLMADDNADGTVNGSAVIGGATKVTIKDSALTVAQAQAVRAVHVSPTYEYSITDQDSRIVSAMTASAASKAALVGATSITSYNGAVVKIEDIGGTLRIVGTTSEIGALSSVLKGAAVLYEVNVADLAGNTAKFTTLAGNEKYRVTDTMANLLSGNALVSGPNAASLVATTAGTVAEGGSLLSLNAGASFSLNDTAAKLAAAGTSATVGAAKAVTANTAATFAEAKAINTYAGVSATKSYSISDTDTAYAADSANLGAAINKAANITVTGTTGLTATNAQAIIDATNTGTTTIALVKDTTSLLVAMTKGSNDTITAITLSNNEFATVDQVTKLKDLAGTVTYALKDTAANLAASTYLNGATANGSALAIEATTDATLVEAATLDAATPSNAQTKYSIADTADNILAATAAQLARDTDGSVKVTNAAITAGVATQLNDLDVANNTFTIFQGGLVGKYTLADSYANLTAAANATVVGAAAAITVQGVLTVSQGTAIKAANVNITPAFDVKDTYANLATSINTTLTAYNVEVSNLLSAAQGANAYNTFGGVSGNLVYNVRDSAANVVANLVSSKAAASVALTGSASVLNAASLSEMTNISGGYAISDTASAIQGALDTVNAYNALDRETILGATSVTVTGFASVAEALGVVAGADRGLYKVPNITYSIKDSAAAIITGLGGIDANGIAIAQKVELSGSGDLSVAQAVTLTGLANFGGYDHDANATTAGIYNIVDTAAQVQIGDTALIAGAAAVTATGTADGSNTADTIDFSAFGRGLTISAGDGADNVFGSDYADVIIGGTGKDSLTGGAGNDTFQFAGGDSGTISGTVYDVVTDFVVGVGGDKLDLVGTPVVRANTLTPIDVSDRTSESDTVNADVLNGIITLTGSGANNVNSLDEWIAVARDVVTINGQIAAFVFDGDTYVYQENTAGDLLIQLDNVTGITGFSNVGAASNVIYFG